MRRAFLWPSSGTSISIVVPLPVGGDLERAAQRFDAIAEPDQSGPLAGVGSADPIVADRQLQDRVGCVEFDVHDGCVRVLGGHDRTAFRRAAFFRTSYSRISMG
jgi:hypothetical protein